MPSIHAWWMSVKLNKSILDSSTVLVLYCVLNSHHLAWLATVFLIQCKGAITNVSVLLFSILIKSIFWTWRIKNSQILSQTSKLNEYQWRIQDFAEGVRQLPKVLLVFNFLLKTAWKWKNFDWGRVPGAPLDPPMNINEMNFFELNWTGINIFHAYNWVSQ